MTANPPGDASKAHNASLFNKRTPPRDTRQHSPCRYCYTDCVSDDATALLQFHCPNCGKEHTNTRGASIQHTTWINRYATTNEPNR